MTLGLDCTAAIDPGHVTAAGYSVIFRYLSNSPWKNLIMSSAPYGTELTSYTTNGIGVVFNWESSGHIDDSQTNHPGDAHAQGIEDATRAQAQASLMGHPDAVIYFSIDFDCSDWAGLTSYFQAIASVIGVARTGVYGGYWVVDHCHRAGLVSFIWQTLAWSVVNGQKYTRHPAANAVQRVGTVYVGGVACDVNEIVTPDVGQIVKPTIPNDEVDELTPYQAAQLDAILLQLNGSSDPTKAPGWPASRWNLAPGETQPSYTLVDFIRALDQQLSTRYNLLGRPVDPTDNDTFIGQILSLRAELATTLAALGAELHDSEGAEPVGEPAPTVVVSA